MTVSLKIVAYQITPEVEAELDRLDRETMKNVLVDAIEDLLIDRIVKEGYDDNKSVGDVVTDVLRYRGIV